MKVENIGEYHKKNIENNHKKIVEKKEKLSRRRFAIFLIVVILMIFSGINMLSAAFYMKAENINKHFIFIGMFFIVYMFFGNIKKISKGKISYKILSNRKLNAFIFLFSIIILTGMFIGGHIGLSFIPKTNGAYGWIRIKGISIQPAEILKCAFVINMANCLARAEDRDASEGEVILYSLIYLVSYIVLILAQKDLGTVIHYCLIWAFMVFMSKIKSIKIWIVSIVVSIGAIVILIIMYIKASYGGSYKIMRVKSYIDGLFFGEYSDDFGYQVKQSVYAFGSGGIIGKGYANGVQKYSYLPEIHTDFIMATFGEEFGIIGMIFILSLIFTLYHLIILTGRECKNYFGKYLAIGIAGQIIIQVIINIFVAVGLLPVFGLPMPFFSYGGSAMITLGISMAIIHNLNLEAA